MVLHRPVETTALNVHVRENAIHSYKSLNVAITFGHFRVGYLVFLVFLSARTGSNWGFNHPAASKEPGDAAPTRSTRAGLWPRQP
jgi:hypothetical protein